MILPPILHDFGGFLCYLQQKCDVAHTFWVSVKKNNIFEIAKLNLNKRR